MFGHVDGNRENCGAFEDIAYRSIGSRSPARMTPERFILPPNDWVPNNSNLSVLVYRLLETGDCETVAQAFEARFARNGWPPDWRDTVYDYHHYHSTAHEALGIAAGNAILELGGPVGRKVEVASGTPSCCPLAPDIGGSARARISSW